MALRLAVVGPTASGKTALALRLAAESSEGDGAAAEVLCVDSMTVYRGMDIGTAKALAEEQRRFVHHGLDLVDPTTEFSVAEFQQYARAVLSSADERGAPTVMVGGTGLYVDAVVNNFTMPGQYPEVRARLQGDLDDRGVADLYARLVLLDPTAASKMEPSNDRRVLRALEVCIGSGRPFSSFGPGLQASRDAADEIRLVGVSWPRDELRRRIEQRFAVQLEAGFVAEAAALLERFGDRLSRTASQALGYRELWAYLRGDSSLDEAIELALTRTRQFAVRQERWFRRDQRILWLRPDDAATVRFDTLT